MPLRCLLFPHSDGTNHATDENEFLWVCFLYIHRLYNVVLPLFVLLLCSYCSLFGSLFVSCFVRSFEHVENNTMCNSHSLRIFSPFSPYECLRFINDKVVQILMEDNPRSVSPIQLLR